MRRFTLSAVLIAACAACAAGCGYGDETSHLGDLLEHDSFGLDMDYRPDGDDLLIFLGNRHYSSGHCLALGDGLTVTVNGVAQPVEQARLDPGDFGDTFTCPSVWVKGVHALGDPLTLEMVDGTRPAGDPFAVFTTDLHNPTGEHVAVPAPAADGAIHVRAGDPLIMTLPAGESADDVHYYVYPSAPCTTAGNVTTCGMTPTDGSYDGVPDVSGRELRIPVRPTGKYSPSNLEMFFFTGRDAGACPHTACRYTIYRMLDAQIVVE